jgi:Domain of unknown function (DUF3854)
MLPTLIPTAPTPLHDFTTEFLLGSAIQPALYAAAIRVVDDLEIAPAGTIATPIHDALNWRYTRFGFKANQSQQAALLLNEDGSCWQAKLATPQLDRKTGKPRKYETPIGNGSRAFLPPLPPTLRQRIPLPDRLDFPNDGSAWDFIADHPEIPIVLTEGGKKSLAGLSQGFVTISLYGINAGVSKFETIGGERIRRLQPLLIDDLQRFAVPGRKFVLALRLRLGIRSRVR